MALLKYGAVIVDSRGSIAGQTLKGTRAGPVMQTKSNARKPATTFGAPRRAALAAASQRWYTALTSTQRTAWRALAAANPRPNIWGDSVALSGFAFFVGHNLLLNSIGAAPLTDAPADQSVQQLTSLSLTATAPGTIELAFSASPVPAGHVLVVSASRSISPGIIPGAKHVRQIAAYAAGTTSPIDIAPDYFARWAALVAAKQYAATAALVNLTNAAKSVVFSTSALAS